jgi:membrane-bound lytic murein transglycosylase D
VDSEELISANRELLFNVTPPGQDHYLKVPGKNVEKITAALAGDEFPLIHHYIHTIHYGDTIFALAQHYGTTVNQILAFNPGVQERQLRIGNRLLIPALREVGPYERSPLPREDIDFSGTHLVMRGETLWSIAMAHEINPVILAEANGMEINDILREGKLLKTPIK